MTVASNTGPLIALAKVDRLSILKDLFGEVHIPSAVHHELLARSGPETARLDAALTQFLRVAKAPQPSPRVRLAISRLGPGEKQAVASAHELEALLIIDDRQGRNAARGLNMPITGVVGVLIQAKEMGLISAVRPLLDEVRQQGYWLSDELIDVATDLAGES